MKVNMIQNRERFDKSASSHAEGYAAAPPPQFTGKAFLLEVREHLVYIPSKIDYLYLYCKLRQHVLNHRVNQFQTPDPE